MHGYTAEEDISNRVKNYITEKLSLSWKKPVGFIYR
jgi:hypothetical protein